MNALRRSVLLATLVLFPACDDGDGTARRPGGGGGGEGVGDAAAGEDAAPDAGAVDAATDVGRDVGGAGGADAVRLNEVACRGDEWVELHNPGDAAVDVSGWVLTDQPALDEHRYALPAGSTVPAGGWLVVRAATGEEPGFPFGLSCAGETLDLLDASERPIDRVETADPGPGLTLGRLPDGGGAWVSTTPTPGEANTAPEAADMALNEVLCRGDDAVELVNLSDRAALLTGWALTDDPERARHTIPNGTEVAASGFLLLRSDGADGFGFGIACGEETVYLLAPGGVVADQASPPDGDPEQSWGRVPDGTGEWQATEPTAGGSNAAAPAR